MMMRTTLSLICLAALCACVANGQQAISAKPGMIHEVLGSVLLDGKAVESKFGEFPQMRANTSLETGEGRAEVLLGPGSVLWVGENSAVTMLSDRLTETKIKLLKGNAAIEVTELLDGSSVAVLCGNAVISLHKAGLYRFDAEPARLMVYDGVAAVEQGGQSQEVKKSRMLLLNGVATAEKFNNKLGDPLLRWAKRRSEAMAMANAPVARAIADGGTRWGRNGWIWNPYFGMFTYVPMRGVYHSFWGWNYWSPDQVYRVYAPPVQYSSGFGQPDYSGGRGYSTPAPTSAGTSGVVAAAASAQSAPASTAAPPSTGRSGGSTGRSR